MAANERRVQARQSRRFITAALCAGAATMVASTSVAQADASALLARVGERIQQYFARAQSIVCTEVIVLQSVSADFLAEGRSRELVYELRLSWEPAGDDGQPPDVRLLRQLVRVDGHAPRPGDEPECTDPDAEAAEPLAMLLPGRQHEYVFTRRGTARIGLRESVMLDYTALSRGTADVTFTGDCVSIALPGRSRGRIWIDAATDDVLRLDSEMIGTFDFDVPQRFWRRGAPKSMAMERADSSIRYQSVTFHDPEETVVLPASIRTITVFRNAPTPRLRTTQTFSNYRRFMTGGRVVKDAIDR